MFDIELTKHLAELSKLSFSGSELLKINGEMSEIINLMDTVKDFDRSSDTHELKPALYENTRDDIVKESSPTEDIIKNAKAVKDNAFTVPKVV